VIYPSRETRGESKVAGAGSKYIIPSKKKRTIKELNEASKDLHRNRSRPRSIRSAAELPDDLFEMPIAEIPGAASRHYGGSNESARIARVCGWAGTSSSEWRFGLFGTERVKDGGSSPAGESRSYEGGEGWAVDSGDEAKRETA